MDHGDAQFARRERRRRINRFPLELNLAFVGHINTGKDFPQCALAGAVLAHQRVATAALDIDAHAVERQHAWETLGDFMEGKEAHRAFDATNRDDWS